MKPNLIRSPSFESAAGWTFQGPPWAGRTTSYARTGAWSGYFGQNRIGGLGGYATGEIDQTGIDITPGVSVALHCFVNGVLAGTELAPVLRVDHGLGAGWEDVAQLDSWDNTNAFSLFDAGVFQANSASLAIRIDGDRLTNFTGSRFWVVDDVEAHVAQVKWTAIQGLITVLKGINGTGFHTDLGGRVYTRLITPEDKVKVTFPYACVPILFGEQVTEHEGLVTKRKWRQPVFCFVRAPEPQSRESATAEAAANLEDDIFRAVMLDDTLGGTVADAQIVDIASQAGVLRQYGEVQVYIDLLQVFDPSDLAP